MRPVRAFFAGCLFASVLCAGHALAEEATASAASAVAPDQPASVAGTPAPTAEAAQGVDPSEDSAAAPAPVADATAPVYDPWEGTNRGLYGFNRALDRVILGPITHVYMTITPKPVRRGVSNALVNLSRPRIAANDLLQGHPKRAGKALGSFAIDSTIGMLGFLDVSGRVGIARHEADFGQTLGRYGAEPGPYVFAPVVGPSNIRDGLGSIVDAVADPFNLMFSDIGREFRYSRTGLTVLDARAQLDPMLKSLDTSTADPYAAIRSAYGQQRAELVRSSTGEVADLPDIGPAP